MKISIIGAGRLGSLLAFETAKRELADELVLVDIAKDLAEGQAMDTSHAIAHQSNTKVEAGSYAETAGSDIIAVAAGRPRAPGQTRMDLADGNGRIVAEIGKQIKENAAGAILITLTNPMDVMNFLLLKKTGFPREKVIGSGPHLDSARFKTILSKKYGVPVKSIEAYVIGEHGEFQAPVFSKVKINGVKKEFSDWEKESLKEELRGTAIQVISKKGATDFAPISCTVEMIEAIAKNEKKTIPCSVALEGEYNLRDLSIGIPVILGKNGIEEILEWELGAFEKGLFLKGAEGIKEMASKLLEKM